MSVERIYYNKLKKVEDVLDFYLRQYPAHSSYSDDDIREPLLAIKKIIEDSDVQ